MICYKASWVLGIACITTEWRLGGSAGENLKADFYEFGVLSFKNFIEF